MMVVLAKGGGCGIAVVTVVAVVPSGQSAGGCGCGRSWWSRWSW